ncbi:hypothetical protein BC938DRAFT_475871, partial [Jimgerdemannia flammicorona]
MKRSVFSARRIPGQIRLPACSSRYCRGSCRWCYGPRRDEEEQERRVPLPPSSKGVLPVFGHAGGYNRHRLPRSHPHPGQSPRGTRPGVRRAHRRRLFPEAYDEPQLHYISAIVANIKGIIYREFAPLPFP